MDYYTLKIGENYWTLQKTTVDCKRDKRENGKDVLVVSPRGRASIWLSNLGVLRVYTDKTTKHYFSNTDFISVQKSYVSYQKDKNPDEHYYCSEKLNNLLELIPNEISDECKQLINIIKHVKIQKSHKHKNNKNVKVEEKQNNINNYFGIFDDDLKEEE